MTLLLLVWATGQELRWPSSAPPLGANVGLRLRRAFGGGGLHPATDAAEIREGMDIDRHPATDPTGGALRLRQPDDSPCAGNAPEGGIETRREEELRGYGDAAAAAFHRSDGGVHPAQGLTLQARPDHPWPVRLGEQRTQTTGTQLHLRPIGPQHRRHAHSGWRARGSAPASALGRDVDRLQTA